jgi:hypothetical protein
VTVPNIAGPGQLFYCPVVRIREGDGSAAESNPYCVVIFQWRMNNGSVLKTDSISIDEARRTVLCDDEA